MSTHFIHLHTTRRYTHKYSDQRKCNLVICRCKTSPRGGYSPEGQIKNVALHPGSSRNSGSATHCVRKFKRTPATHERSTCGTRPGSAGGNPSPLHSRKRPNSPGLGRAHCSTLSATRPPRSREREARALRLGAPRRGGPAARGASSPGAGERRAPSLPPLHGQGPRRPGAQRPRAAGGDAARARVPPPAAPPRRLARGRQQLPAAPQCARPHHPRGGRS